MKLIVLLSLLTIGTANAGILKVTTFPVRHPVRTLKIIGKIIY